MDDQGNNVAIWDIETGHLLGTFLLIENNGKIAPVASSQVECKREVRRSCDSQAADQRLRTPEYASAGDEASEDRGRRRL